MARIPIPLDSDGFLRRACPSCEREFKWFPTDEATDPDPRGYCCPYCATWAQPDQWFTETQLDYLEKAGPAAVADEVNEVLSESSESFGLLKYTPSNPPSAPGEMPPEPNDMRRVDFGCHPEDPLKVAEEWNEPIHCLICGSST
ncbi:MAG TPA: hypothetical protein VN752_08890 [Solirubrobacterales bacterium]|nr:hypothetical protein [Solirubrobacterales bacterium]